MLTECCKRRFQPVTHVIFDLDGTILDTESINHEAFTVIANEYGKSFTEEVANKIKGCVLRETARRCIEYMELPISVEEFIKMFLECTYEKYPDCNFMPGAEKIIKHLSDNGVPIAVATSSGSTEVEAKISKKQEVFNLFHHIVAGGSDPEVQNGKPEPDIFLVAASRFPDKPHPSECLVFEDAYNGVLAALAAGMQVVMIPDNSVPYEMWKNATLRLDSFEYMAPEFFGLAPMVYPEPFEMPPVDTVGDLVKYEPEPEPKLEPEPEREPAETLEKEEYNFVFRDDLSNADVEQDKIENPN